MKFRLLIFISIFFFNSCSNESKNQNVRSIVQNAETHNSHLQWLQYEFSDEIQALYDSTGDKEMVSYLYSNIGLYFKALEFYEKNNNKPANNPANFDTSSLILIPALDYITKEAQNRQVIIINEAHHVSYHRFFTMLLIEKLCKIGFNYFGAETLTLADSNINSRGYPLINSGYYSVEPQYSNLIRQALSNGYKVFPYEPNIVTNDAQREIDQATNIAKILKENPKARIVIHCGYSHILEGENIGTWGKAMAGRLKEITGIDPLTVNQVSLTETFYHKNENPLFKIIKASKSMVVKPKLASSSLIIDKQLADVYVFHPRTCLKYGRPEWLFTKYKSELINKKIKISYPVIAKAFFLEENVEVATPIDVIEIKSTNDSIALALIPKKNYKILIQNKQGLQQTLTIAK